MLSSLGLLYLALASAAAFPITFRLYTHPNRSVYQVIDRNNPSSLSSSNFNPSADTKFIIHGWSQNGASPFVIDMMNALLDYDASYNVISVDWEQGADSGTYYGSTPNVYVVGDEMDLFIRFLNQQVGYSYSRVHLIGFSLGAQCSGQAGMRNPSIARITGLDPASPDFEGHPINERLDASDAQFVDVIHTDGDTFTGIGGYGTWEPTGDVDFYPNGGKDQPGCINVGKRDVSVYGSMGCDHGRAPEYFTESINSGPGCLFAACPCALGQTCICTSEQKMGFHALKSMGGIFYLETLKDMPYCLA